VWYASISRRWRSSGSTLGPVSYVPTSSTRQEASPPTNVDGSGSGRENSIGTRSVCESSLGSPATHASDNPVGPLGPLGALGLEKLLFRFVGNAFCSASSEP
jgi:hypothetical protein